MKYLLSQRVTAVVLIALISTPATAQQGRPLGGPLTNARLADVEDPTLDSILGWLRLERRVVPSDDTVASFPELSTPVVVVPLTDLDDRGRSLFLFYLPDKRTFYFLQRETAANGAPEARLWGAGPSELTMASKGLSYSSAPSVGTFRLPSDELALLGARPQDASSDALACIGRTLGIDLNFDSLSSTLASSACSVGNVVSTGTALVLTATNCLSIPGLGSNLVFATLGCVAGIAHIVSCGLTNCAFSPAPSPNPTPSRCVSSLTVGQQQSDRWVPECHSANRAGRYAKFYTFTLSREQEIQVDLEAVADTFVYLLRGGGASTDVIASDDDGGDDTNSRISQRLQAGTYTIEATTFDSGISGAFSVRLSERSSNTPPSSPQSCLSTINIGSSASGSWGSNCSSVHRPASYAQYYRFSLPSQARVQIDLESSQDAYLFLLRGSDSNGSVVDINDDFGGGTNSRLAITLPPGSYVIEATTYESRVIGSFRVTLQSQ